MAQADPAAVGRRWPSLAAALLALGLVLAVVGVAGTSSLLAPGSPLPALAVEQVRLHEGVIELRVRNAGPTEATIAQVAVNDAYWSHEATPATLGRLGASRVRIPYPWEPGLPLAIDLVLSDGTVVSHEVEAALPTPRADGGRLASFALLGVLIGLVPVAAGLVWAPVLSRASRRARRFAVGLSLGLLAFLLVETVVEGLESAALVAGPLNGSGLLVLGAAAAWSVIRGVEAAAARRRTASVRKTLGLSTAVLAACAIGLHNLGEGMAVTTAVTAGEAALGASLFTGFALHNVTEGIAILAVAGAARLRPRDFVILAALAGLPASAGAVAGAYAVGPLPRTVVFGIAAGAIAEVVVSVWRWSRDGARGAGEGLPLGFFAGVAVMYATGLLVAA